MPACSNKAAGSFSSTCSTCRDIDSQGIGEIVGAYTRVTRERGALKLCHVAPRVIEVLRATNLDVVLESFEDEASALHEMAREEPEG